MRGTISENLYIQGCNDFVTVIVDGLFPASGSFIDVSKFTHFAFMVNAGSLDSELTLQVQEHDSATGTATDVTSATATVEAGDDDYLYLIEVEVARLSVDHHYVTLDVEGQAGSNDYLAIFFIGWNARHAPITAWGEMDTTTEIVG